MKKGFGILAGLAVAALLTPYDVQIDKENKSYKFKSLLLTVAVKQEKNEEGKTDTECDISFSGVPTKDDMTTLKNNVSHIAGEGAKLAKTTADKVREKFAEKTCECCCDDDCCEDECCEDDCCCNETAGDECCCDEKCDCGTEETDGKCDCAKDGE